MVVMFYGNINNNNYYANPGIGVNTVGHIHSVQMFLDLPSLLNDIPRVWVPGEPNAQPLHREGQPIGGSSCQPLKLFVNRGTKMKATKLRVIFLLLTLITLDVTAQ